MRWSVGLIFTSLLLLLAFQGFWLQKVWQEHYELLRQQTDKLFSQTVMSLQDSLISVQFEPNKQSGALPKQLRAVGITRPAVMPQASKQTHDSLRSPHMVITMATGMLRESLNTKNIERVIIKKDTSTALTSRVMRFVYRSDSLSPPHTDTVRRLNGEVRIIMSGPLPQRQDVLKKVLRPFIAKVSQQHHSQFVVKLNNDSIRLGTLQHNYRKALQQAKIGLDFKVLRVVKPQKLADSTGFLTELVPTGFPAEAGYAAQFTAYKAYLFQKISPQILFSLLLFSITTFAFGLTYNNLQQQRRLTQLKNDFISNVTHELKTPITTVGVAMEALSNFNVLSNPQQTKEYLAISKNELSRLSMLVDKVLKMAMFEHQAPEQLRLETLDLSELVAGVLQSMRLQFERFNASVAFERTGDDFVLAADQVHLTNVLYNLLDNALKYSVQQPQISLELLQQPNALLLSVSDNGPGIPKVYQQKIFEKFFRVPTGNVHNVKGYGLGLSYVASVVAQHDGHIEVESQTDKGSKFTVVLPRNK